MNILLFNGINGLTTGKIKTSKELIIDRSNYTSWSNPNYMTCTHSYESNRLLLLDKMSTYFDPGIENYKRIYKYDSRANLVKTTFDFSSYVNPL